MVLTSTIIFMSRLKTFQTTLVLVDDNVAASSFSEAVLHKMMIDFIETIRTIYKLEKTFQEPNLRNLAISVREKIEDFRDRMPIIFTLGNPGLKTRHWEQISEIIGVSIKVDADLTLAKVLEMGLDSLASKFEGISDSASKEATLEKAIDRMQKDWAELAFTVNPFKDTGTYVIAGVDDIQLLLDDHIVKTVTIKNSPNIKPFESRILLVNYCSSRLQILYANIRFSKCSYKSQN